MEYFPPFNSQFPDDFLRRFPFHQKSTMSGVLKISAPNSKKELVYFVRMISFLIYKKVSLLAESMDE